jgi:hypothetical protein
LFSEYKPLKFLLGWGRTRNKTHARDQTHQTGSNYWQNASWNMNVWNHISIFQCQCMELQQNKVTSWSIIVRQFWYFKSCTIILFLVGLHFVVSCQISCQIWRCVKFSITFGAVYLGKCQAHYCCVFEPVSEVTFVYACARKRKRGVQVSAGLSCDWIPTIGFANLPYCNLRRFPVLSLLVHFERETFGL